ncbi:hypothetical protein SDJN03_06812, partial [Cucurbita argyrosperma subsp. sororia]
MKRKRFKRVTLRIGSVMEDEIGEEFERSGFTFDEEEEILKKYRLILQPAFDITSDLRLLIFSLPTQAFWKQISFHPLWPPAAGVPLDFSLAPEALDISVIPDVHILPSNMKHFGKVISINEGGSEEEQVSCVCVNPETLAKDEGVLL